MYKIILITLSILMFIVTNSVANNDFSDYYYKSKVNTEIINKNYNKAYKYLNKLKETDEIIYNKANLLYKSKKYKEALREYKKIEKTENQNLKYKTLFNEGNTYAFLKKYNKALEKYEEAEKIKKEKDLINNIKIIKQLIKKQNQQNKKNDKKQNQQNKKNDKKQNQQNKKNDKKQNQQNKKNDKKQNQQNKKNDKKQNQQNKKNDKKQNQQNKKNDKKQNQQNKKNDKKQNQQNKKNNKKQNQQNKKSIKDKINEYNIKKYKKLLKRRKLNTLLIPLNNSQRIDYESNY